jgi:predicted flap endonuclease-1-like 5' DNA nuclease
VPEIELPQAEATFAELKVPEIELPQEELPQVDELELPAAVEVEPPLIAATMPQEDNDVVALRDEVTSLRALLAQLQAQQGQPSATAPSAEPPAAVPDAGAGRLPGADEIARIAAEMAAITSSRSAGATLEPSQTAQVPRPVQKRPSTGEDNLEIIMGVGPIYAKRLREAGITTYQQLAEASYEVLDKVSRGNLERVIKEDWRGQAQRLMNRQA